MGEPLITGPPGGWTTADLDELPESNQRYELTDGTLTVSPSPSNLHQWLAHNLGGALAAQIPEIYTVALAVEVRFGPQLTRIPDALVVRTDDPALYAQYGIPHYWRIEQEPLRVTVYRLGAADAYVIGATNDRLSVTDPFLVDLPLASLLPRWAR
ncbi:MAG TPA: Uma2 family endonuclease [Pseudonocardiaceae bacterium]|nr:Uma2 family endonuclease [Pseudonocardiaceae bacterium]